MPSDGKHFTIPRIAQAHAPVERSRPRRSRYTSDSDSESDAGLGDTAEDRPVAARSESRKSNALHEEDIDHDDHDHQSDEDGGHDSDHEDTMSKENEAAAAVSSIEGITGRSWDIDRIGGTRELRGVVEYLVHWAPSRHATSQVEIQTQQNDKTFVLVEAAPWPVSRAIPYGGEEHQTTIEWVPTWHPIWELRCALKAIARYQRHHPAVRSGPARVFDVRETPTLSYSTIYDPEPDGKPGLMDGYMICPEEGLDYTRSLLALLKHDSDIDRIHITSSVATNLNMPARQQLTFRPEFVASAMSYRMNANNLLAATTYVAGYACEIPCDHCKSAAVLPFPKCVTSPNFNGGACTNCSLSKASVTCTHRHDVRCQQLARPDRLRLIDSDDEGDEEVCESPTDTPLERTVNDDRGDDDSSDAAERVLLAKMSIRRDRFPLAQTELEVLDLSEDHPGAGLALLNVKPPDPATDGDGPSFSSSRSDDCTSESSPLPDCGMLESSPDVAGGIGELSSQQTSPSPFDPTACSSPDAQIARRKRRRGSDVSVGPSRRRQRSGLSSNRANAPHTTSTTRPSHTSTLYAEHPGGPDMVCSPGSESDAPLLEKVVAAPTGFNHPECRPWAPRCRHTFIDSGIKNGVTQSSPVVKTSRLVSNNRPNDQRRNSLNILPTSSRGPQLISKTVSCDQHFTAGELTEPQIRFILSRCHCRTTELLHDAWEMARKEDSGLDCKFKYLSRERVQEMNAVIGRFCPRRLGTREHPIVL
ncbi:hypothetical protein TI39_contig259g00006 [Zymoseptoria brevis]|uniref:Chromo domain-containing protein n=1 Tax=Zymoseptoria brevis TaxID=1047168 RepID=A0A0F4GXE0_9PEZI|nr:hypothetical protein TI39_contig259g00006 [Zymoseptoria brevis]